MYPQPSESSDHTSLTAGSESHAESLSDLSMTEIGRLTSVCAEVRQSIFQIIQAAGSGHLGACSSSTELLVALYFGGILKYDSTNPTHPQRDRLLVRGHLGPLRYKIFSMLGWLDPSELLSYRQLGSRLQGHESMIAVPGVDITPSGSLGMLLSYGVGSAISLRDRNSAAKCFVLLGDGEEQEGNVSEAARHAASLKLSNMVCILDRNGGQLGTRNINVDGAVNIKQLWEGYGWEVLTIPEGNNIAAVLHSLRNRLNEPLTKPLFIILNTEKGLGLKGNTDNFCGYHTITSCSNDIVTEGIAAQAQLVTAHGISFSSSLRSIAAAAASEVLSKNTAQFTSRIGFPDFSSNDHRNQVDAQAAFFKALNQSLRANDGPFVYVITPDLLNDVDIEPFGLGKPINFYNVGVREQHAFAMAHGLAITDPEALIFINSGDAFLYRAADQLNACAQGGSRIIILADRCGLSGGQNGSTHQSSGHSGLISTMPGITFLEPADALDVKNCFRKALLTAAGPVYLRFHMAPCIPLQRKAEDMDNADFYFVGETFDTPDLILVSAGLATFGATQAQQLLLQAGIQANVMNVVDLKSLDERFASKLGTGCPIVTIYNGNEFILRSRVTSAFFLGTTKKPTNIFGHGFEIGTSGKVGDLLPHFGLDGAGIVDLVKRKLAI